MKFEDLVTRMVHDLEFRRAVVSDPEKALKSAGVNPTPEMVSALKGVSADSLGKVARAFGAKTDAQSTS